MKSYTVKQFKFVWGLIFPELTYCIVELLFYLTLNVWATLLTDIPASNMSIARFH